MSPQPPVLTQETLLERTLVTQRYRCEQDIARCKNPHAQVMCPWYGPDKLAKLQHELDQIHAVMEFLRQSTANGKPFGVDL